jgi:ribosomal protein S12 methylthiotransferase
MQVPAIFFTTLGCPKNEADTDHMRSLVQLAGYQLASRPEDADVIVVNTCSFLTDASEESIDCIFELLDVRRADGEAPKLVVSGCLPSRYGRDLEDELVEAAAFLPCEREEHIVEVVERLTGQSRPNDFSHEPSSRTGGTTSAYVKISDGCDRFCSFCAIPNIRGRYFSRPERQIVDEVSNLVANDAREVVLVGQDTSIWGSDFDVPSSLPVLLDHLASRFPDTWLRVLYLQPEGITDELLDVMAEHDNVCNYLDMPLQHASARILSEMNRSGSGDEFAKIVARVRRRIPDIRLRTTFICGFPGETDEDFEELADFAQEVAFDYAGVFPYSRENGTIAGERDDQVPEQIRIERANALRSICEAAGFSRTSIHVGEEAPVLFEGYEMTDGGLESVGRIQGQAPEIDGGVHVGGIEIPVGQLARVRLVDSFCFEYEGELIS